MGGVFGGASFGYDASNCIQEFVNGEYKCNVWGDGRHCEILVFEDNGVTDLGSAGGGDVNFMAAVVFIRVSNIIAHSGVRGPGLTGCGIEVQMGGHCSHVGPIGGHRMRQ